MSGDHTKCNDWDYSTHPSKALVAQRCDEYLVILKDRPSQFDGGYSTLSAHAYFFNGLCPPACAYLAGNYRGSNFPCLITYNVQIRGEPRVGTPAAEVAFGMQLFEHQLHTTISGFAADFAKAGGLSATMLSEFVGILARYMVYFFTIHPYANGNGHTGRFLVGLLLARFGMPLGTWPLDKSPQYGDAINEHRNGNKAPLENFMLARILA